MNKTMSITSKYQVTIPKEVRRKLNIGSEDKVTFVEEDGVVRLERDRPDSLEDIQAMTHDHIKRHGIKPQSDADLKRAREIFYEQGLQW